MITGQAILCDLNPEQVEIVKHDKGPLLATAVAGSGKCVTGDTIIATAEGPRRIDQCANVTEISHSIDTRTLVRTPAGGALFDLGIAPVLEVETDHGYVIRGTLEHPLLVWRGEPVWVPLQSLSPEDLLMLVPGYGLNTGLSHVDPDEAYLLGLMMGDGWTCRRGARGNRISWSRGGEHLPPVFYELVDKFWHGVPKATHKSGTNSISHSWGDKATYDRLRRLGCAFSSARDKRVPAWLLGATPAERIGFLQGYFDTDGSASGSSVEIVSASEHLARDVQQLLLSLGVVSHRSPKMVDGYDHVYWRLTISGEPLREFATSIGFRKEIDKKRRLQTIAGRKCNPNKGCYPYTSGLLRSLKSQWAAADRWDGHCQALDSKRVADYLHDRRFPSKRKILDMVNGCSGREAYLLRELTNYYLEPIKSIKERGEEHVYDYHIPGTESFVANGVVSHNTRAVINRIAYLVAVRGVHPSRILAVTFSRKGAQEMNERLHDILGKTQARVGTFHSLALEILKEESETHRSMTVDDTNQYKYCIKDAVGFRGMRWGSADISLLETYISLCKCDLSRPMSKGAERIAQALRNLKPRACNNVYKMMEAYDEAESLRRDRQLLTFDDMLFDVVEMFAQDETTLRRWADRWDYVIQDEAQDQNKAQICIGEALAKYHKNYMLVGDYAQCHPAGTMINVDHDGKSVPIETLATDDTVASWNRKAQKMIGGRLVAVGRRRYTGPIINIKCSNRTVPMTPDHKVLARWTDRKDRDTCVVYLMYRSGLGYRLGWCQLFASRGNNSNLFHLAQRTRLEKADKAWILHITKDRTEASITESILATRYTVPTLTFEPVNGANHITRESIDLLYAKVGDLSRDGGEELLRIYGLDKDLPLWPWPPQTINGLSDYEAKHRRGTYFPVYAINVIPGLMSLPLPDDRNVWAAVSSKKRYHVCNEYVYSLDVEKDHSYAANGVVVLNCIYTFRGAHPETLLSFEQKWGAKKVSMTRNYRCGQEIIDVANWSLAHMDPETRLHDGMQCELGTDAAVECITYSNLDDEGEGVAEEILQLMEDGVEPKDVAILYRVNAQSRAPEEALISNRIPYVVVGGTNFYNRREVKNLMAYLRLAEGRGGIEDVERCINSPFRYLGKAFVGRVRTVYQRAMASTFGGRNRVNLPGVVREACKGSGIQHRQQRSAFDWADLIEHTYGLLHQEEPVVPSRILQDIVMATKYTDWLRRDEGEETVENSRVSNVRELIRAAARFPTATELLDYIDKVVRESNTNAREFRKANKVVLSTIHKAKGLEWPVVYMIGVSNGVLPHGLSEDIEEERRLFYVAVTRAKSALTISHVNRVVLNGVERSLEASPFLEECGLI